MMLMERKKCALPAKKYILTVLLLTALAATLAFSPLTAAAMSATAEVSEPAAGSLATYAFTSPGWATFGLALPRGEAFTGLRVGQLITQVDVKNRWPDGSIRYAILTVRVEETGSYDIYESAPATGSFTPLIPTARLELNIEGKTLYVSNLPATINADLWLDGPLVKEWRVRDIPAHDGAAHPFLSNIWDVRVYSDGTGTVDATVENIRDVAEADGVVYGVDIYVNGAVAYHHAMSRPGKNPITDIGGSYTDCVSVEHGLVSGNNIRITSGPASGEVFCVSGLGNGAAADTIYLLGRRFPIGAIVEESWESVFYHQYGARWRKVIPTEVFVEAFTQIDFTPFIRANAVPEYMPTVYDAAVLRGYGDWQGADPLGYSSMCVYMPTTGGRPDIGPYPRWAARYMARQTSELREQTLSLGDLAGSWAIHFAKNEPSQLMSLDENPNYYLNTQTSAENKPLNNLRGRSNGYYNSAHAPSLPYIPYLITGNRYYSDEMLFRANYAVLSAYPGYPGSALLRRGAQGILWEQEMRAIAWALRDLTDAAFFLPDGSPYKNYFKRIMDTNLQVMDEYVAALEPPLGIVNFGGSRASDNEQFAPWQYAYFAWALQHAIEQGEAPAYAEPAGSIVRDSIFRALFEPAIIETGFLPEYLDGYWVKYATRGGAGIGGTVFYETWQELFENNYLNEDGSPAPISSWSYGVNLHVALISAKKAGYPGIDKAYDFCVSMSERSASKYMTLLPNDSAWAFADVPTAVRPPTATVYGVLLCQNSSRPATVELFNSAGIRVALTEADENGAYTLSAAAGTGYSLVINKPAYLRYTVKNFTITDGEVVGTIDIRQMAGDIDGDGVVNATDLTYLLSEFNRSPLLYEYADIDGNGVVNATDLTYLLAGFNKHNVEIIM